MSSIFKKIISLTIAIVVALSITACKKPGNSSSGSSSQGGQNEGQTNVLNNVTKAKNLILMIGDGMGPVQIQAGEIFKGEPLTMQGFPYKTTVETRSASDYVTDSAAGGTALATGVRTINGVVGKNPALQDLQTITDIAKSLGKSTGVIATEELYGATPMTFSAHANGRGEQQTLLTSAATTSDINLFASYVLSQDYQNIFTNAGYTLVEDVDDISEATQEKVFGNYYISGKAESMSADPNSVAFDRLITEALEYLSKDEDGFFLMAEGSHIDHGGHNNDICYMLEELLAFDDAIAAVLNWAKNRNDTVVIIVADHETGGLALADDITHEDLVAVYESAGYGSCYSWSTTGHTDTPINCYINGANINFSKYSFGNKSKIKNTDVFKIMKSLLGA